MTGSTLPPPVDHDMLRSDETALFCIRTHMSGLPLSPQVTTRGGRLLRAARTTAAYRLNALGNHPGLVRPSQGAAIKCEVWALPTATIGKLLGQDPPPLGSRNVTPAEGPHLGFLAEAAGVEGAKDITRFDGWRGWLTARDAA